MRATRPIVLGVFACAGLTAALAAPPATPAPSATSAAAATRPSTRPVGPLTPRDAIASFELEPGLKVELVAAEPLVASPCAVAWDERGRMFVAENRGYPTGGPGGKPAGVVAMLEDTDGDGLPDKRAEFATGLSFPNGLLPWRGGLIVTDSPDVLLLTDADGDGRAERREVLLTGLATDKSTQLRANDPTLGPDGWVYLAGGLSGGKVYSPRQPDKVLDLARTDLKFRPDTGELAPAEGKGQYGLTFDDAGHRFVCFNRVQVQHAPLPSRYLARNPGVASPGVLHNCPDLVRNVMLSLRFDAGARIFPISANVTTADSHAGTYSAACAVHVARGDALPAEYVGRAWSCDPTGNLVRYDELVPAGGSFHARRVRDDVEALRSRDDWFRPVFLADGPDGALYVCDMYRLNIEHPDYLPEELRKTTDFESGKDMGRIWRIVRTDLTPADLAAKRGESLKAIAATDAPALAAALRSPNGWVRDAAFRLLADSKDPAPLESLAASPDAPAAAVVSALNLLANASALKPATLLAATGHADPIVRENAVRLSEDHLAGAPELAGRVLELTADPHVHVRYAAVLAAGQVGRPAGPTSASAPATGQGSDAPAASAPAASTSAAAGRAFAPADRERIVAALARVAASPDADDKWVRAAIASSLPGDEGAWDLLAKLAAAPSPSDGVLDLLHDLGALCAAGAEPIAVHGTFERLVTGVVTGVGTGGGAGRGTGDVHGRVAVLVGFVEQGGMPVIKALRERVAAGPDGPLARVVAEAGRVAADAGAPVPRRVRAVELVALAGDPAGEDVLLALVVPEQPAELAMAAARRLVQPSRGKAAAAASAAKLLERKRWARYTPALRGTVVTLLTGRPEFAPPVLDALESGAVPTSALAEPQRAWLRKSPDAAVVARAEKLLAAGGASADRQQAFEQARAALQLKPNSAAGRVVFTTHCANCHRLDREGYAVGPDLLGIRSQPKESILLHIVIPEQEVAANFAAYDCVTTDGRTLSGIMSAETPASITLRQALGIEETIPRDRIKRLQASKFSLMPPGMEQAMSQQELADLLAYLRGEK